MRSMRDRYGLLEKRSKKKIQEKEATLDPEPSELDEAMLDITQQLEEGELKTQTDPQSMDYPLDPILGSPHGPSSMGDKFFKIHFSFWIILYYRESLMTSSN